ncbi:MAG: (2Fe-2S)-binding protein [Actinobacteria bacterium]|nr:(2Fe-2S)-binding protein [Actinomycetota bacterium]
MNAERLDFRFEGGVVSGVAGQSIGSALHAAGVRVLSSSFKYRRPRGLYCVAGACPNCAVRVDGLPGVPACVTPLRGGEIVERDRRSSVMDPVPDRISRWVPAGFYYHRLPRRPWLWLRTERVLARIAAAGRLPDPDAAAALLDGGFEERRVEVVVVGAGSAGLDAAAGAARAGSSVLVLERDHQPGGFLLSEPGGATRAGELVTAATGAGAELMLGATALGWFEEGLLAVATRSGLIALEPGRLVLATGSYERGLPFADGDRPGVMLAAGAQRMLVRDGVRPGGRIVVITDEPYGHAAAALLHGAGIDVSVVDRRPADAAHADAVDAGVPVLAGRTIAAAHGRRSVEAISVVGPNGRSRLPCDAVAIAVGRRPADELLLERLYAGSVILETAPERPPGVEVAGER